MLEREEVCPPPKRESGHRFRSVRAHSKMRGKLAYRVRSRFDENYMPTIAPRFDLLERDGYRAKLWDVSGDERYTTLAFPLADFHNIDVYILVFDITTRSVRPVRLLCAPLCGRCVRGSGRCVLCTQCTLCAAALRGSAIAQFPAYAWGNTGFSLRGHASSHIETLTTPLCAPLPAFPDI